MDPTSLDQLAARLISQGGHFARVASRSSGVHRPVVALRVLANLQLEGAQRIGRLAAHERLTQPAMTATVNRLEADGLVRRSSDAGDARAVIVELTPQGLAELSAFRAHAAARIRPSLERLSGADLDVLARAADLLEQLSDEAEPTPVRAPAMAGTTREGEK